MKKEKYVVQLNIKGESCPCFKVYDSNNDMIKQVYCSDIESECDTYDDVVDYVKLQWFDDWGWSEFNELVEIEIY